MQYINKTKMEWENIGERAYFPFSFSLNGSQNSKLYLKQYGDFDIGDKSIMYENRFYFPKGETAAIAEHQIKRYRAEGASYLWGMAHACEERGDDFLKAVQLLIGEEIRDTQQRVRNFEAIMEEYRKFVVFMSMPWALDDFFGTELHEMLTKRNLKERVEIEKKLNQPIKQNDGELEQMSLLRIAGMMNHERDFNPVVSDAVERHVREYAWLPMRWLMGTPMTKDDVLSRLERIRASGDCTAKLAELEQHPETIRAETEEAMGQLHLDPEERELILLLKEYVFIRTFRSDRINKALFTIMPVLAAAARELGITYEDILLLSYQEIIACLKDSAALKQINLEERKRSWLLYRDGEHITVVSGKEAEDFARAQGVVEGTHEAVEEIRGSVAYRGIVSGTAKIVSNPNDISKVERGDILIAVMTFPSYIAAMERAAAFVTDEGGVLCHAAIVAREMKKPCVIAAKRATKIFKDGDLVEVDADHGIVRIIKRA